MIMYIRLMCILWFTNGDKIFLHIKKIKRFKRIFNSLQNPTRKKESVLIKLLLPQWFIVDWYKKLNYNNSPDIERLVWNALHNDNKKKLSNNYYRYI